MKKHFIWVILALFCCGRSDLASDPDPSDAIDTIVEQFFKDEKWDKNSDWEVNYSVESVPLQ